MRVGLVRLCGYGVGKAFGGGLLCEEAGSGGERSEEDAGRSAARERGSGEPSGLQDG